MESALYSTNIDCFVRDSLRWHLTFVAFCLSCLSCVNNSLNNVTTPSTNQRFWPDSGQILRHQYGISVAESQTFLRVKRPQRRRTRRNGCFRRLPFFGSTRKADPPRNGVCGSILSSCLWRVVLRDRPSNGFEGDWTWLEYYWLLNWLLSWLLQFICTSYPS